MAPRSPETLREAPEISVTVPKKATEKVTGADGSPLEAPTKRSVDWVFQLWSSRIASSSEEIKVLLLSAGLGVREALAIACDFNWKLSARFYAALTRVSPPASNSATVQARSAIPAAIAGVHRKV